MSFFAATAISTYASAEDRVPTLDRNNSFILRPANAAAGRPYGQLELNKGGFIRLGSCNASATVCEPEFSEKGKYVGEIHYSVKIDNFNYRVTVFTEKVLGVMDGQPVYSHTPLLSMTCIHSNGITGCGERYLSR